jgi:hypothetical protein
MFKKIFKKILTSIAANVNSSKLLCSEIFYHVFEQEAVAG